MKTLLVLSLLGSLTTTACAANGHGAALATGTQGHIICRGAIEVRNQADIDAIKGCDTIQGDLVVAGANITNLEGLERLRSVRYLVIANNPLLESIEGLKSLESARGVTLMGNPVLDSARGLDHLKTLEGAVVVDNGISSVDGLTGLQNVGELVVAHNPRLKNLDGLTATARVSEIEDNGNALPAVARRF